MHRSSESMRRREMAEGQPSHRGGGMGALGKWTPFQKAGCVDLGLRMTAWAQLDRGHERRDSAPASHPKCQILWQLPLRT